MFVASDQVSRGVREGHQGNEAIGRRRAGVAAPEADDVADQPGGVQGPAREARGHGGEAQPHRPG